MCIDQGDSTFFLTLHGNRVLSRLTIHGQALLNGIIPQHRKLYLLCIGVTDLLNALGSIIAYRKVSSAPFPKSSPLLLDTTINIKQYILDEQLCN